MSYSRNLKTKQRAPWKSGKGERYQTFEMTDCALTSFHECVSPGYVGQHSKLIRPTAQERLRLGNLSFQLAIGPIKRNYRKMVPPSIALSCRKICSSPFIIITRFISDFFVSKKQLSSLLENYKVSSKWRIISQCPLSCPLYGPEFALT